MRSPIRLFALAVSLILTTLATAEVKIAPFDRVKNRPPGRCGWCVVETLARHHLIRSLYHLTEDHPSRADPADLEQALQEANVRYRIQYPGTTAPQILEDAIHRNLGAAVGFRELGPGLGGHIVTLVDYNPTRVKVLDPSDEEYRIRTLSREQFENWWDGFALVLEKPRAVHKVAQKK